MLFTLAAIASGADLRHPAITALTRETPAQVSPGAPITYRFTHQPGTAATTTVTLYFRTPDFTVFRAVSTSNAASGVASVTVPPTWVNGSYILDFMDVVDAWNRTVRFHADGLVSEFHSSNPLEPFYTGPTTHSFDFSALGFTVTDASTRPPRAEFSSITIPTTAPLTPGDTLRIRFSGTAGATALTRVTFVFRHQTSTTLRHSVSVDIDTPNGEATLPVTSAMTNGTYRLETIQTVDAEGKQAVYNDQNRVVESIGTVAFQVTSTTEGFVGLPFVIAGAASANAPLQLTTWSRSHTDAVQVGSTFQFNYATASSSSYPFARATFRLSGPFGASRVFASDQPNGAFAIPIDASWTSGTYTITQLTLTDAAGRAYYYLPFGGQAPGPIYSAPGGRENFQFTVRALDITPYFSMQPEAESFAPKDRWAYLNARVASLEPVTYRWFRGQPGDTSRPVSDEISGTGQNFPVMVTGPDTYWVRATSGSTVLISRAARVDIMLPPVITEQPKAQVVIVGETVTFTVKATGVGLTYRWFGGINDSNTRRDASTYQFTARANDTRSENLVQCEVRNEAGSVYTEKIALTVLDDKTPLRITREPAEQVFSNLQSRAAFTAQFSGMPPLRFRWQKDGVDIARTIRTSYNTSDTASLDMLDVTASDLGNYRLVVSGGFETIYSQEVPLRIAQAPHIRSQPRATLPPATLNNSIRLDVDVVGQAPLRYQWRKDGSVVADSTNAAFIKPNAQPSDDGLYEVVVSNALGSVTSKTLEVRLLARQEAPGIGVRPTSRTVRAGETVTFTIEPTGGRRRLIEWLYNNIVLLSGPDATSFTLRNVVGSDSGGYRVRIGDENGSSAGADFTLTVTPAQDALVVIRQPVGATVERGATARLSVGIDGNRSLPVQWRRNGVPFNGYGHTLEIANFGSEHVGAYDAVATNSSGTVTSAQAQLSLPPPSESGRLANLSVRASAGAQQGPLIVGFVLGGGVPEDVPLLIRAAGPALENFGVSGVLANPRITLYAGSKPRYENDDWSGYPLIANTSARVGAFPFPTTSPREAALAPSLAPGSYSVHVAPSGTGSGVTLAEVYDATPAGEISDSRPRLINFSVQTNVAPGAPVFAGFVIRGSQPRRVLVRAAGPSLAGFGVQGAHPDPTLDVMREGVRLAENNDWAGAEDIRVVTAAVGAFAFPSTTSKDAAVVTTLPPGAYSAQVSSNGNTTGAVLVEIYEIP